VFTQARYVFIYIQSMQEWSREPNDEIIYMYIDKYIYIYMCCVYVCVYTHIFICACVHLYIMIVRVYMNV